MKKIKLTIIIAIAFFVSSCDTNDDGFYNNVFAEVPNLVTIDPHPNVYNAGEKLYLNADFSRYLNENGNMLDAFATTGATQFAFTYIIEKQINATTWETVTVNDNQLDIIKGSAQNGSYLYALCNYNTADESYEYRVGFPLSTVGIYRMSFGYNSDSLTKVELRSISPATRLILNINSNVSQLDANGYYNFTVI